MPFAGTSKHVVPRFRFAQPCPSACICPIDGCNFRFSKPSNLYRHCREKTDVRHQKLSAFYSRKHCRICGKHFPKPLYRERHEKLHSILVDTGGLDILPLPTVRLTSFDPVEDQLISFYVYRLAPSRTLYKDDDLYKILLDLSLDFCYLRDSIRSLVASYLKREFTENAALRWRVAALGALQQRLKSLEHTALEDLREMKAILGCTALLLQYAVKNPNREWADQVRRLGPLLRWAIPHPDTLHLRVRLASHHVLANTATGSRKQFPHAPFLHENEEGIQKISPQVLKINGSICASPQMLNLIQRITLAKNQADAKILVQEIQDIEQELSEPVDHEKTQVILQTAETFRLGALEYTNLRFPGIISYADLKVARNKILAIYEFLPLHGPLYTAMHNLWGLFMCAVGTPSKARVEKIMCKMEHNTESNVCPAVTLIRTKVWKTQATDWEDRTEEFGIPSLT